LHVFLFIFLLIISANIPATRAGGEGVFAFRAVRLGSCQRSLTFFAVARPVLWAKKKLYSQTPLPRLRLLEGAKVGML
jgi:hypothetical protein